ncbi:MAG: F0F1 ATP synthase subunit delta [Armatimonadetes bacterium]|nr:F0F1 ATP synthase subunit delta [Armatimonadota bacterium]
MREESVSRRYAAALFNQAKATNTLKETSADLAHVAEALVGNAALARMIGHPLATVSRKKMVLDAAFSKAVSPATLGFLSLLADKRRMDLLADAKTEFDALVRAHNNVVSASATTAVPLSAAQLAALEKALEARTGKDIELTTSVDPSLMGGILVRIGDTVLDGTVKGKLERLREQLLTKK